MGNEQHRGKITTSHLQRQRRTANDKKKPFTSSHNARVSIQESQCETKSQLLPSQPKQLKRKFTSWLRHSAYWCANECQKYLVSKGFSKKGAKLAHQET